MGLEYKIFDLFYLNNPDYSLNRDKDSIDSFNKIYLYRQGEELLCLKRSGLYIILKEGDAYEE